MQGIIRVLFIFLFSIKSWGHQPLKGKITAALGVYIYETVLNQSEASHLFSQNQKSLSLMVEGDLHEYGGVEASMTYMKKQYFRGVGNQWISEQVKRMYMTLGYRFWMFPWLSVAAAQYSTFSMGDARIESSDFIPQDQYATSARDPMEYGLDLSVQVEPWSKGIHSVIIDYRYSTALSEREGEESDHRALFIAYKKEVRP